MRDRNRGKRGRQQPIQTGVNLWVRYRIAAFDFFFLKTISTLKNGCVRGEVEFVPVYLSEPFSTTPEALAVNPFSGDHAPTATELVRNLSVYFKHCITSVCGDGEVTRFSSLQPCVFSKRFQKRAVCHGLIISLYELARVASGSTEEATLIVHAAQGAPYWSTY